MWFRSRISEAGTPSAAHSRKSAKRRRRRAAGRLQLESLESRCLLAFMAPVNYPAGPHVSTLAGSVAAADFANNGLQDLAVVNGNNYLGYPNASTVSIMAGNGDGTFKPPVTFATGNDPVSLAVGDLTSDGKLDIVTANDGTQGYSTSYGYYQYRYTPAVPPSMSVLLGNGDGTFQAPLNFALPEAQLSGSTATAQQYPLSIAVGDMNHDGHPDLVVEASSVPYFGLNGAAYVDVLLGHGDGTFTTASTTLISNQALKGTEQVSLADFSGDGNLDVAVPAGDRGAVAILRGGGDGTLSAPTYFSTGVNSGLISLAVGDTNGDGKLDLVTANDPASNNGPIVSVLLGNGGGTFQAPIVSVLNGGSHPLAIVAGDLDHDGKLDLAVAATSFYSLYGGYYETQTVGDTNVNVLLGNGDGTFTDTQTVSLGTPSYAGAIAAANFNGDGFLDLALPGPASALSVLLNGADWVPAAPPSSFSMSGFPSLTQAGTSGNFTLTALNADGTVDTGYSGTVNFTSSDAQAALPAAYTFTAADAGKHTFNAILKTAGTQSITATDAAARTVTGSESGIAITPGAASRFDISVPASSTAGSAFSITVTARDPYNNIATGYTGTLHFTSTDGQGVVPRDYTFTAADAGVHTFTNAVTLKTAGDITLWAIDTSTYLSSSIEAAVIPAAASTMIVYGFPSSTTAGASGNFTVMLKDAYGNVAWGYTGTVHFTSSDAKAVLPANYTFTKTDSGKHTFSATLKTAGTQSITATDTANASLHGTDAGTTVKPAAASKFLVSAPSSVMPGAPFRLTVTVEDAYGNIVTGYVGTVHFTSSDSQAHLPANYTFTAGNNGVHTFTGLVLKKTGNQTITVTDTKNSSITGKTVVDVV